MKKALEETNYYFVDESGDPTFYNSKGRLIVGVEGCSKIFIMGFIETKNPNLIRSELKKLRISLINDKYLSDIPSMAKTSISFHAKDDCPEVRQAVYKKISEFDFKAQFIIARKIENVFRKTFKYSQDKFYDYLITRLFENVMHKNKVNVVYFAKRGSKNRQKPLEKAIKTAITAFENKWNTQIADDLEFNIHAQMPSAESCLQVVDYMNWAVYRAFTKREMRYYKYIESKVSLLIDIYDTKNYPQSYYHKRNPFHVNKISPI